jgi:4'-phosphopantetheinyl transferase
MQIPLPQDEVHLIFCRLCEVRNMAENLRTLLSPGETERAERFRFDKDRDSFILAHSLLRIILGRYLRLSPENLPLTSGPYGKPFLSGGEPIRFNLSHSEGLVLYGLSHAHDLGVDIEYIRSIDDMDLIAQRFFSAAESRDLASLPSALRTRAFFNCWTRKEAFIKAVGEGLSYPLSEFQVSLRPDRIAEFICIRGQRASETEWSLHDISPSDDYAAALALANRRCAIRVWKFDGPNQCAGFFGRT